MAPPADYQGPSFLGIGAPRAGTSWLYDQLRCHPQLWLPPIKELHYWDLQRPGAREHYPRVYWNWWAMRAFFARNNYRWLVERTCRGQIPISWAFRYAVGFSTDRWYQRLFPTDCVCGEITPGYMLLPPPVIEQIRQMNPRMKAILLLRNPVSRAWSNLCHMLGSKVHAASIERLRTLLERPGSLARGDYVRTINNWRGILGENRVFIGFFDDLVTNPRELMRRVLEFLEVDNGDERLSQNIEKEVNAARGKRVMPDELIPHTYGLYLDQLRTLEKMLGGHVSKWLAKAEEAVAKAGRG